MADIQFTLEDREWLLRNCIRDPDATVADTFLARSLLKARDIKENPEHRLHERYRHARLNHIFVSVAEDTIWMIKGGHKWPEMKEHVKSFEVALRPYRFRRREP